MGPNQRTCIASKAGAPTNEPGSISYLPFTPVGFKGGSVVKNLPANAGDAGSIPAREDPLEKAMAIHSSILAWEISWTEEPGRLQSTGSQRVRLDWGCTHILPAPAMCLPLLHMVGVLLMVSCTCLTTVHWFYLFSSQAYIKRDTVPFIKKLSLMLPTPFFNLDCFVACFY